MVSSQVLIPMLKGFLNQCDTPFSFEFFDFILKALFSHKRSTTALKIQQLWSVTTIKFGRCFNGKFIKRAYLSIRMSENLLIG